MVGVITDRFVNGTREGVANFTESNNGQFHQSNTEHAGVIQLKY